MKEVSDLCTILVVTSTQSNSCSQDTSQTLRSALEDKAKKSGGTSRKGKRQMRPGQAKTLSDLPQLSS
jgi:hypothetical protein